MLGAIAGDIIGSIYEGEQASQIDLGMFCSSIQFIDDAVLTVAIADSLLTGKPCISCPSWQRLIKCYRSVLKREQLDRACVGCLVGACAWADVQCRPCGGELCERSAAKSG